MWPYHAFSARPTLRDKPTQKTRIYWPPSWHRASMGMFTSVIVPGYLQFTATHTPMNRARDNWWTLDFASAFLSPGVNSRGELVPSPLAYARNGALRSWLGGKSAKINLCYRNIRNQAQWASMRSSKYPGILEIHACNNPSPIFSKHCFNMKYSWLRQHWTQARVARHVCHGNTIIFKTFFSVLPDHEQSSQFCELFVLDMNFLWTTRVCEHFMNFSK
jgi:hypothetical protein